MVLTYQIFKDISIFLAHTLYRCDSQINLFECYHLFEYCTISRIIFETIISLNNFENTCHFVVAAQNDRCIYIYIYDNKKRKTSVAYFGNSATTWFLKSYPFIDLMCNCNQKSYYAFLTLSLISALCVFPDVQATWDGCQRDLRSEPGVHACSDLCDQQSESCTSRCFTLEQQVWDSLPHWLH